jgi:hypothetical protein
LVVKLIGKLANLQHLVDHGARSFELPITLPSAMETIQVTQPLGIKAPLPLQVQHVKDLYVGDLSRSDRSNPWEHARLLKWPAGIESLCGSISRIDDVRLTIPMSSGHRQIEDTGGLDPNMTSSGSFEAFKRSIFLGDPFEGQHLSIGKMLVVIPFCAPTPGSGMESWWVSRRWPIFPKPTC